VKKALIATLALVMVSGMAFAAIEPGDPHDLSGLLSTPNSRVCMPCHVPHRAPHYEDGPLWNHDLSEETFTVHGGGTTTLTGSSKLCMGCHDGVTDLGSFGGSTAVGFGALAANEPENIGGGPLGTETKLLADDHPIGIAYPAHGPYNDPATTSYAYGRMLDTHLEDGKIECGTCHSAHTWGDAAAGKRPYLKVSIIASELCRKCHTF